MVNKTITKQNRTKQKKERKNCIQIYMNNKCVCWLLVCVRVCWFVYFYASVCLSIRFRYMCRSLNIKLAKPAKCNFVAACCNTFTHTQLLTHTYLTVQHCIIFLLLLLVLLLMFLSVL